MPIYANSPGERSALTSLIAPLIGIALFVGRWKDQWACAANLAPGGPRPVLRHVCALIGGEIVGTVAVHGRHCHLSGNTPDRCRQATDRDSIRHAPPPVVPPHAASKACETVVRSTLCHGGTQANAKD